MNMKTILKMCICFIVSSVIAGIVYLLNGIYYGVNDDYGMAQIISNDKVFGNGEYNVFNNIVLGKILKGLNTINNHFNWYGIVMFLCVVTSCAVLGYIFWNSYKRIYLILPIVLIEVLCIFYISFTMTAFVLTSTSILSAIYIAKNKAYLKTKKTVVGLIVSTIMFVIGFMYRYESCVIAVLIMIPLCFYYRKVITKRMVMVLATNLLLVVCLHTFNNYCYQHNGWDKYTNYLGARGIIDFSPIDYNKHKSELAEMKLSKNDIDCFYHWIYADKQVYSESTLKKVKTQMTFSEKYNTNVASIIKTMITNEMNAALLLVGIFGIVCLGKREKKYTIALLLLIYITAIALIVIQRFIGRVYFPMILVGIIEILFLIKKTDINKKAVIMITGTTLCLAVLIGFKWHAMKKQFVPFETNQKVENYISTHQNTLFVMNSSAHDLVFTSKKSIFDRSKCEKNVQTLGGWMLYHKQYYEKMKNYAGNPDRVLISLVKDKDILYIDGKTDDLNYKRIKQYLFEHTGKRIKRKMVKDFKNTNIAIYKFDYK